MNFPLPMNRIAKAFSLTATVVAALACTNAAAQLKPGGGTGLNVPAAPAAAAPAAPRSSANAEKEAEGKLAAAGWLVLLDRRDWGRAWETSAGMFRSTVPLGNWMDGIPKVREPLGAFVERVPGDSVYKTTLEGRPNGDYVTVGFVSKFEKQETEEMVTVVRESDGKWRVTGYKVR
ncbi:MAG: DUF4019 domain-containing protein [Pseudomonadota bacterium]|jgi:hypothetical protein